MKTLPLTLIALALLAGPAAAESRRIPVQALRSLDVAGPFEVIVTRGAAGAVLEGDAADLAKVQFEATGEGLRVWRTCRFNCNDRNFDVTLRLSSPDLAALTLSKGVEAKFNDSASPQMAVDVRMGSSLEIAGACDTLRAKAAMGAQIVADDLVCRSVIVNAAMGADARVHATASAEARASMGANIEIAGKPPAVDSDAGMGASIDAD